jgi:arsenate reductase (thioredoxin)
MSTLGVLFLCVANSSRSQIAEGLARRALGPKVRVQSAGSRASHVNPLAVTVMGEIGVDIGSHTSKSVDTIDPASVDVVVTLCAEEVCPAFLGEARRLHWPLPDPTVHGNGEAGLTAFRATRDDITRRLAGLRAELGGDT